MKAKKEVLCACQILISFNPELEVGRALVYRGKEPFCEKGRVSLIKEPDEIGEIQKQCVVLGLGNAPVFTIPITQSESIGRFAERMIKRHGLDNVFTKECVEAANGK